MLQSQALAILKTGANVFLTGEPGSGKSHTINEYAAYLRKRGIDPAVTASTGIAATHIGGMTIHSWSGIGIKSYLDKYELDKIASTEYIVKRVRRAKVLVIDEVSMLPPDTLSMVDAVCRTIKQSHYAFGGLQIIFVGDFFQLPPIVRAEKNWNAQISLIDNPQARFAYDSPAWKRANPMTCYLTEQHRQDDPAYLSLLSAIRRNKFADGHLCQIETRRVAAESAPEEAPKLFTHNADVDRVNDQRLASIKGKPVTFDMSAHGPSGLIFSLKKGCMSPETLVLKIGAKVMFTKNNPKEGFVNGTLGTVEDFDSLVGMPIIRTHDGRQILAEKMDWTVEEGGKARARISQLPLRLAWAITVHKSQGMSLDEAVVDLSEVFEFGQGYVALSRVRRLSGLHLLGWNERAFEVHPDVLAEDEMLRAGSEASELAFSEIPEDELQKMHVNFINASSGHFVDGNVIPNGREGSVSVAKKKRKARVAKKKVWSLS